MEGLYALIPFIPVIIASSLAAWRDLSLGRMYETCKAWMESYDQGIELHYGLCHNYWKRYGKRDIPWWVLVWWKPSRFNLSSFRNKKFSLDWWFDKPWICNSQRKRYCELIINKHNKDFI